MLKHPFEHELTSALKQFDFLINRDYLRKLNHFTLSPCVNHKDCLLLFKINTLTLPTTYTFFTYVLNALASLETTIAFILTQHKGILHFYIGLKISTVPNISAEILMQGFASTFSPNELTSLDQKESELLLKQLFSPNNSTALTSAIIVPNNTSPTNTPLLKNFSSLFTHEDYTALFLATPAPPCHLQKHTEDLIQLFNTLSQFSQANHNLFKGIAHNTCCTLTNNRTDTCGDSCTLTDSSNCGASTAAYTNLSPSTAVPLGNSSRSINVSMTFNHATGNNETNSTSVAKGNNNSHSQGDSESNLDGTNVTDNKTLIYTKQNKAVSDALTELTALITRFSNTGSNTFFYFNAFFLAPLMSTTIRAGYTYAGLATDSNPSLEPVFINTWSHCDADYTSLLSQLQCLHLPYFNLPHSSKTIRACSTITSTELLNTFCFPFTS